MKGYRTILVGLAAAIGAPAIQYIGAVNWADYLSPTAAIVVAGVVQIAMRFITTGPVGEK